MENKQKPEDIIFEALLASKDIDLKNISEKDLRILIEDKITKFNPLIEEWQVGYAVDRIIDRIEDSKSQKIVKEEIPVIRKFIYGFFLVVFLLIGAGVWTWKLPLILSIIISIISVTLINVFWGELRK